MWIAFCLVSTQCLTETHLRSLTRRTVYEMMNIELFSSARHVNVFLSGTLTQPSIPNHYTRSAILDNHLYSVPNKLITLECFLIPFLHVLRAHDTLNTQALP